MKALEIKVAAAEIKEAMFSIPNDKAPGLDGFGSSFYKATWGITGSDIIKVVMYIFENGKLLRKSMLHLTLIPKTECPQTEADLRPIFVVM